MRSLSKLALGAVLAVGLVGTAAAAARSVHVTNVALPDGSTARVQYVGDVAPRITLVPVVPVAVPQVGIPVGFAFPDLGSAFARMDREMAATMQQVNALASQPLAGGPATANLASYGSLPPGTTSYSSVSVIDNGRQCSRTTEVIGQGADKAPKVLSKVSGDCGPAAQAAPAVHGAPAAAAAPAAAMPDGPIHQS
jgi:hypothetical protein